MPTTASPSPPSAQPADVVFGAALVAALARHSQGKVPLYPVRPVDGQKVVQGGGAARGGVFGDPGGRTPAVLVTDESPREGICRRSRWIYGLGEQRFHSIHEEPT